MICIIVYVYYKDMHVCEYASVYIPDCLGFLFIFLLRLFLVFDDGRDDRCRDGCDNDRVFSPFDCLDFVVDCDCG